VASAPPMGQAVQHPRYFPGSVSARVAGFTDSASFTQYRIELSFRGVGADGTETALQGGVLHRYSDFDTLHKQLLPSLGTTIPAEFPVPKAIFNGGAEFKQERARGLDAYLQTVLSHAPPALPPPLCRFLGLDPQPAQPLAQPVAAAAPPPPPVAEAVVVQGTPLA